MSAHYRERFSGVVTDTTGGDHDPGRIEIRGNVGLVDQNAEVADRQIEPDTGPTSAASQLRCR